MYAIRVGLDNTTTSRIQVNPAVILILLPTVNLKVYLFVCQYNSNHELFSYDIMILSKCIVILICISYLAREPIRVSTLILGKAALASRNCRSVVSPGAREGIKNADYVMKFLMHLHWLLILLDTAS